MRQGEENIGYSWVSPEAPWSVGSTYEKKGKEDAARLELDTGILTVEQVNRMLTNLQSISLLLMRTMIVYYSQTRERIFPRSLGIIGRKV